MRRISLYCMMQERATILLTVFDVCVPQIGRDGDKISGSVNNSVSFEGRAYLDYDAFVRE